MCFSRYPATYISQSILVNELTVLFSILLTIHFNVTSDKKSLNLSESGLSGQHLII